jgi:hypothetical protein
MAATLCTEGPRRALPLPVRALAGAKYSDTAQFASRAVRVWRMLADVAEISLRVATIQSFEQFELTSSWRCSGTNEFEARHNLLDQLRDVGWPLEESGRGRRA